MNDEVEDTGKVRLSTWWVIIGKLVDGQNPVKSRLVARGFEEHSKVRLDSPPANKESFLIFLGIPSKMGWKTLAIDIKAAFLQGEDITIEEFFYSPQVKLELKNNFKWLLHEICIWSE